MNRTLTRSQLVTVNFPNVNFTAFTPVTTLGNTIFNFQKAKKLKRIYPVSSSVGIINIWGRIRFLDINGNAMQIYPVTSASGAGAIPAVRIDSRLPYLEFINLEIGGFVVTNVTVEVTAIIDFQLTFEFEEEYQEMVF